MPFLVIVSFLPLSLSLSPATLSPSLRSSPCGFCIALPCFRPSLRTGSSTDCAAPFWRTWEGKKKKNTFLLWEQSKVSLTSTPLIKLSCQKHINNRQHNSLHRERGGGGGVGESAFGKKKRFLIRCVKRQSTKGSGAFQRFLPLSFFVPLIIWLWGPYYEGPRCRVSFI